MSGKGLGGLFRVILPSGRTIESPGSVKIPVGAKRWASFWAGDVGVRGTIRLEMKQGDAWVPFAVGHVKDSEFQRWEAASAPLDGHQG